MWVGYANGNTPFDRVRVVITQVSLIPSNYDIIGFDGFALGQVPPCTPSTPTLTLDIVAADGANADEGLSGGDEYLLNVGSEVWWAGNFGDLGLKARITDPLVDGGYPGPTNITTLPNAFMVFGWVYDTADVWAFSESAGVRRITKINAATKAVTVYSPINAISLHVDNSNNLWRRSMTGAAIDPYIRQIDKTTPGAAHLAQRNFNSAPVEIAFVGSDCFASVGANPPNGNPVLEKVTSANVLTTIDLSAHISIRPANFAAAPDRGSIFMWAQGKLLEVAAATGAVVKATTPVAAITSSPDGKMIYDQANGVLIFTDKAPNPAPHKVYAVSATTGLVVAEHTVTIPFFQAFNFAYVGPVAVHLAAGQVLATALISPSNIDPIYYTEQVVIRIRYTP
jgi:hypothetical protein